MPDSHSIMVGGQPIRTLRPPLGPTAGRPGFVSVDVAPGRGMLILQARLRLANGAETNLFASPPLDAIAGILDGGPEDFAGSASFSLGGAILLPYANRITGRPVEPRQIETEVAGRPVRLPRNWGGKAAGAAQYAMHGLLLAMGADSLEETSSPAGAALRGIFEPGDFSGCWPSRCQVEIEVAVAAHQLRLSVRARNTGTEPLPMGIGWHPYFALPSGRRSQARLQVPAAERLEVGNYDEVLPTGRILDVAGTPYDFRAGAELGERYLDDCFTGLQRDETGEIACRIEDPAGGHGVRISSASPAVTAIQVYAPPERACVALEHQFNWPDPYGEEWRGRHTGMVLLKPREETRFEVCVEPFQI